MMRGIGDDDMVSHSTSCIYTQDTSAVRTVADDDNDAIVVPKWQPEQTTMD